MNITHVKLPAVRRAIQERPWAILPGKLEALLEVVEQHATAGGFSVDEIRARIGEPRAAARAQAVPRSGGKVALLSMTGIIAHRMDMFMAFSGGTSTQRFSDEFDAAMADEEVSDIVIDCDSPGGSVVGTPELAKRIYDARGKGKRIIAVANGLMASAAYWICAAADEVVATPSAEVGSIGVFCVHLDATSYFEKEGLKHTIVRAGDHKAEGNPYEALSEDALAHMQSQVDEFYGMFVNAVATYRGRAVQDVEAKYGQGRTLLAKPALAAGMVDRIATLEETLQRLGATNVGASGRPRRAASTTTAARAAVDEEPLEEEEIVADMRKCPECGADVDETEETCPECGAPMGDDEGMDDEEDPETEKSARGGARAGEGPAPERTRPAHQARSHTMSDKDAAAQRAANEQAVKEERQRASAIRALGKKHGITEDKIEALIDEGTSVDAAATRILGMLADGNASRPAVGNGVAVGKNRAENDPKRGFESHRDFMLAVMGAAGTRERAQLNDERLRAVAVADKDDKQAAGELAFVLPQAFTPRGMLAAAGSDEQGGYSDRYGGIAVPTQVIPTLLSVGGAIGGDPTAGRTQPLPMGAPIVSIPALTDKNHTTSVSGGFTVTRKPETVSASPSRTEMEGVELKATGLFGLAFSSEELLSDSPISFAAIIQTGFERQFPAHLLNEKIRGKGGNEFLGVLNSPAKVAVAAEGGQAADTINATNILKMAARQWNLGNAIWIANHGARVQLATANIAVGTAGSGGVLLYQPAREEGFPDMLWGRPVFYSEFASALGDEGDLMLVDWSQYLEGLYQPLQTAESVHVRFVNHERAFKSWVRNAGAPWWRSAVTPNKGADSLSPIVTLAAR